MQLDVQVDVLIKVQVHCAIVHTVDIHYAGSVREVQVWVEVQEQVVQQEHK